MTNEDKTPEIVKPFGRPRVDIEEYYIRVCPFLRLGCSVRQSCIQGQVPIQTFVDYLKSEGNDYEWLRLRVEADQNYGALLSKRNIIRKIQDPNADNIEVSKWWLTKKEPEDFGDKLKITGGDTEEELENERKKLNELLDYVKTTPETIDGEAEELPALPGTEVQG